MANRESQPRYADSLQRRFSLSLAIFLVVSMVLLGIALFANQRDLMQERLARDTERLVQSLVDKGTASSTFLARIAPQGLLAHDYLLLESYVEELSADPDIVYAVIFKSDGEPITHYLDPADPYFADRVVDPAHFMDLLSAARADNNLMKVRRDVEYDGGRLGQVEVGLSKAKIWQRAQELESNLQNVMRRTVLITGGLLLASLMALIVLIERVFRRLVIKPVQALSVSMASLQVGDLGARAVVQRGDEIGFLAQRFNRMADDLQAQLFQTEQHALAVQQTRDYLASILDHSADMIATTATDGSIVQFNDAAEKMLGYHRAEVVGRRTDMIFPDLDERNRLYTTVYAGQPVRGAEIRLQRKDGSLIDVELTLSALRNNLGQLLGTVCIGRDVTHAKALRRELVQAEKLASIGQVAAWIAHQIRNYVGRLMLDAGALRPTTEDPEPRRQAHADLGHAIGEMERVVSDLLDYSRSLTLNPTAMKLDVTLDDLLNNLEAELCDAGIRVERDFHPGLPPLHLDVFKVEQAFTNVLRNAMQAMPDGGTLRVRTRPGAEPDCVCVRIEDSGPGIAAEDLDKVFKPFYTTKPAGTGLGLAMARRIVEAHGGNLQAYSTPGAGAQFEFVLPARASPARAASA
jgi:PAS domain S-box-containing protein